MNTTLSKFTVDVTIYNLEALNAEAAEMEVHDALVSAGMENTAEIVAVLED